MRTLYIECAMGAAGDMLMSALYELLDEKQKAEFLETMNGLGLPGVKIVPERTRTCGIAGTHMAVTVYGAEEHDSHPHHHHGHCHSDPGHIAELINGLRLPEEVRRHAGEIYDAIAAAEAEAHGCPVGDVHFHEVGALDAVADVTGVCYLLYLLAPERIQVSPVHVGSGTVRCAHGVMPVPAPATVNLLKGVPVYSNGIRGELCTPTGAAIVAHYAERFGELQMMSGMSVGVGIGTKQFEQANCVRVFMGESADENFGMPGSIAELVCNIDDMTPEALAFARERLIEQGAIDVYTVPGTMKKGRPGWELTVLCSPRHIKETARNILRETTTNGVRVRLCGKYFLHPECRTVETSFGKVQVKTAEGLGIRHMKPEYEDVAAIARKEKLPYGQVFEETVRAYREDRDVFSNEAEKRAED